MASKSAVERIPEYAKAVVAFIAPGAVVIGSSVLATSDGGTSVTVAELITAGVACVVTATGVAKVRNADWTGDRVDEVPAQDVHPDELDHDSDLPDDVDPRPVA